MTEISATARNSNPVTTQYTTDGPIRYSTPPNAGPAITPTSRSIEFSATALGKASGGTRFGVIAELAGIQKARPAPNTPITAKIGQTVRSPVSEHHAKIPAQSAATA